MDNQPLVSILIPNYNKAHYLRETLDSVLAQTYSHWECIIVDDHSSDNSWEILEKYAEKDLRFKTYQRPDDLPKGGNSCRNFAIDGSKGDLVLYLDSDDVLADFCLEQRVNAVNNYQGLDFWAFPTALFQKDVSDAKYYWNVDDPNESDLSRFLRMDVLWQTSGPIYAREFVEKFGGFNPKTIFWQDYEVHLKALILSKNYQKFFHLSPDIFIREGDKNSLSRSTPFTGDLFFLRERIKFLEMVCEYASDLISLDECQNHSFSSLYYFFILQLWLKHGHFKEYRAKWKYLCSKLVGFNQYDPMSYIEPFLLKISNRVKSSHGLLQLLRFLKKRNFPDYKVFEKLNIGLVPISSPS